MLAKSRDSGIIATNDGDSQTRCVLIISRPQAQPDSGAAQAQAQGGAVLSALKIEIPDQHFVF